MKNLKRALSFALATVMLIGMMVVGASAAGFEDADKIVNTDAVNTMVALGIIKGKDNGNFDPEGIVTRAEMAKMICVALNGGKDPNLAGGGLYPDTKGHWASGYIDYCTNLGIVAGDTAGNFNPDKTVTGTEAAKMILIALGYNAENEKFVNDANWSLNINIVANTKNLYKDLAILPAEGLTRDNAAQMLWNGMDAVMVEYDYKLTTSNGDLTTVAIAKDKAGVPTILSEKFSMDTDYGYMTKIEYVEKDAEYKYTFSDGVATHTWAELDDLTVTATTGVLNGQLKSAQDFSDLYGMKVKVLSKTANGKTTVYGMYAVDSTVLFEGVGDDIDTTTAPYTFDDTKIEANTAATSYAYNVNGAATAINAIPTETAFKLIDNNDDGKYDIAVTYPVTVGKVTFVGKDSITAGNQTYKFKDCDIYEGVAKDDYVVVTAATNTKNDTPVIVKAAIETGTVEATKTGDVKLSGTWYSDASAKTGDAYALNKDFELVVVNGFVYYAKQVTEKAKVEDVVYVIAADPAGAGVAAGTQKAQLMFTDGTKKIVTVAKTNANPAVAGKLEVIGSNTGANVVSQDTLYTYSVNSDGNYELSVMVAADYDVVNDEFDKITDGKAVKAAAPADPTIRFNDDSVVFVKGTDKVAVVTGATINKWADITTGISVPLLYANTSNGFAVAAVGKFTYGSAVPGAAGDTSYGWVTAASSVVKSGDYYYVEMTIWNGTETVTVLADKSSSNSFTLSDAQYTKGTPVSYKDKGDGKIDTVTALTAASAVTGYAGGKDIEIGGTAYKITDDTVILYVDTAKNAGVEGGEISIADKDALGNYVKNVYADDITTGGELDYIIVDVSNNLDANRDITFTSVWNKTDKQVKVVSGQTGNQVIAAAEALTGAVDAYVTHDGTAVTGSAVVAGDYVTVTAENGTTYSFTVVINAAGIGA